MYKGKLKFAVIEITNTCNLECAHCASDSGKKRPNELSTNEINKILKELKGLGCEEVTVLGGEPLMRKDWYSICEEVKRLGMRLSLISNGLLINNQEIITKIVALEPHCMGISLDGSNPSSYEESRGVDGFEHCYGVLKKLLKSGLKNVTAITTFTRLNLYEFDDFADLFAGTNIAWQIQMAGSTGNRFNKNRFLTSEDYKWLVQKVKAIIMDRGDEVKLITMDDFGYFPIDPKFRFLHQEWKGCSAGKEVIGIRSNGDVIGCLSLGDQFIEANIREISLSELWTSDNSFYNFRNKAKLLKGHCAECTFSQKCQAGCSMIAYSATGHIGENPYCIRKTEQEEIVSIF